MEQLPKKSDFCDGNGDLDQALYQEALERHGVDLRKKCIRLTEALIRLAHQDYDTTYSPEDYVNHVIFGTEPLWWTH